ncbi:ATP-grasp domain-containing protein [Streptomyces sp. NPDC001635]
MADDRACSFTRYAARERAHELVLLRFEEVRDDLSEPYLEETAHLPAFWVSANVPLEAEAERYLNWVADQPLQPTRFCNPSEPRQHIAQRFAALVGLPHLSAEQVQWVRDKAAMKEKFHRLGLRTAAHQRIQHATEVINFAGIHGWPVVLKPVDSFACIDTHLLNGTDDLRHINLSARRWLAEAYVGGVEWEACALVLDGEVLDVWPSAMPSRPLDIVAGAMNANISVGAGPGPNSDVHGLVQRIVHGMRVDHGYVHLEFFEAGGEIYAGEVGVRVAGCEITANHGHAYGFDVFGATLDAYQGRRPVLDYTARRCVGDLLLPMPRSGTVRAVTSRQELLDLPGVIEAELRVAPGDRVRARRASHNACGYIHVAGTTAAEVEKRMQYALDRFSIDIK